MDNLYAVSFGSLDGTFFIMILSAKDKNIAISKALSYLDPDKTFDFVDAIPVE